MYVWWPTGVVFMLSPLPCFPTFCQSASPSSFNLVYSHVSMAIIAESLHGYSYLSYDEINDDGACA